MFRIILLFADFFLIIQKKLLIEFDFVKQTVTETDKNSIVNAYLFGAISVSTWKNNKIINNGYFLKRGNSKFINFVNFSPYFHLIVNVVECIIRWMRRWISHKFMGFRQNTSWNLCCEIFEIKESHYFSIQYC